MHGGRYALAVSHAHSRPPLVDACGRSPPEEGHRDVRFKMATPLCQCYQVSALELFRVKYQHLNTTKYEGENLNGVIEPPVLLLTESVTIFFSDQAANVPLASYVSSVTVKMSSRCLNSEA